MRFVLCIFISDYVCVRLMFSVSVYILCLYSYHLLLIENSFHCNISYYPYLCLQS